MKRELGIARCGLACCLCSENIKCSGCNSDECPDKDWCENKKCSQEKGLSYCYECKENCKKGLLSKIKPYTFNLFIKKEKTGKKLMYKIIFSKLERKMVHFTIIACKI